MKKIKKFIPYILILTLMFSVCGFAVFHSVAYANAAPAVQAEEKTTATVSLTAEKTTSDTQPALTSTAKSTEAPSATAPVVTTSSEPQIIIVDPPKTTPVETTVREVTTKPQTTPAQTTSLTLTEITSYEVSQTDIVQTTVETTKTPIVPAVTVNPGDFAGDPADSNPGGDFNTTLILIAAAVAAFVLVFTLPPIISKIRKNIIYKYDNN